LSGLSPHREINSFWLIQDKFWAFHFSFSSSKLLLWTFANYSVVIPP
jgi:hypothetical protein